MLFRLVRPVKRSGSRFRQFVRRIPADVRSKAIGLKLSIPIGDQTQVVTVSERAQSVRLSLRTDDPAEVKARLVQVDAYLENVWRALRDDAPVALSHRQATALAGELYRAWADGEGREGSTTIEHDPEFRYPDDHVRRKSSDGKIEITAWRRVSACHVLPEEWEAVLFYWEKIGATADPRRLERPLGPIVDRLLLSKGILRVTSDTRDMILQAFWQAVRDSFESRKRNAEGDYSPDSKASRFPDWAPPQAEMLARSANKVSLKALVEAWWIEAKAIGRQLSTYESHSNTISSFAKYLGHDDASRVTRADVIGFKDARLASINPRNGLPISPKTVKDSDLAGLKTVFGWANANGKMSTNPAEGVTLKLGKPRRVRSKGFTDAEAEAILGASLKITRGRERLKTFLAKRWVPWLCAYTGARVGEVAQLRKEDIRREGKYWIATITPEAGPVKTNEAREVVLHDHIIELGFIKFVEASDPGHLFITPGKGSTVIRALGTVKNRIADFVRTVVADKNVAPSHGWRHRFKTVGIEAGIEHRILDSIQGHSSRNIAEGYGEVTIKSQAAAVGRLPRYKVPSITSSEV